MPTYTPWAPSSIASINDLQGIRAFDGRESGELWAWKRENVRNLTPLFLTPEEGRTTIFVPNKNGLVALNHSGMPIGESSLKAGELSIQDIDLNGREELVVLQANGRVTALNATDGTLLWEVQLPVNAQESRSLGRFLRQYSAAKDNEPVIVVWAEDRIFGISGQGTARWAANIPYYYRNNFDIDFEFTPVPGSRIPSVTPILPPGDKQDATFSYPCYSVDANWKCIIP